MKLNHPKSKRSGERGFFLVVVLLIIASVMLIYLAANVRRIATLKKEIRLVEQTQIQRMQCSPSVATNQVAAPVSGIAP